MPELVHQLELHVWKCSCDITRREHQVTIVDHGKKYNLIFAAMAPHNAEKIETVPPTSKLQNAILEGRLISRVTETVRYPGCKCWHLGHRVFALFYLGQLCFWTNFASLYVNSFHPIPFQTNMMFTRHKEELFEQTGWTSQDRRHVTTTVSVLFGDHSSFKEFATLLFVSE